MLSCPSNLNATQTDPLLITDGHHHVQASLSAACRDHLRTRCSLDPRPNIHAGTLCIVSKYTIRYTSYGPPRNRFRLFLDDIDCVGEDHTANLCADPNSALLSAGEIQETLLLLHRTRELADTRCLSPQAKKEEESDEASYTMAGADEEQASMNTQMPFNTQLQHPIRARKHDEEVAYKGTKPLEPVLAGNTQRAELKYASANSEAQRREILALIQRNPPPPHVRGGLHAGGAFTHKIVSSLCAPSYKPATRLLLLSSQLLVEGRNEG